MHALSAPFPKASPRGVLPAVAAMALAAGCATHPVAMQKAKASLAAPAAPDFSAGAQPFTRAHMEGEDSLLWLQERARANQLAGRIGQSSADYDAAWDIYEKRDDEPVVSLADAGTKAGSLLLSDLAIPYEGNAHERIMVPALDAFNRIASLDWDAAGADIRRLSRVGELERDRNERRVAAAREASEKDGRFTFDDLRQTPAYVQYIGEASAVAANLADAFQNGYAWYLAGFYHEMAGDPSAARTAYRRALEIAAGNGVARRDLARMEAVLAGSPEDRPGSGEADVVVFFEEGYAPRKETFSFLKTLGQQPVPVAVGPVVVSFHFPYYPKAQLEGFSAALQIAEGGAVLARTELVGDFRALAQKAFEAQMPYVLTRAVLRAVAKSAAATVANASVRKQGTGARLAVWLGGLILVSATDQPDLRSWLLLPRFGQVARFRIPAGAHDLVLSHGANVATVPLDAPGGCTILLHAMSVDGRLAVEATGFDLGLP